MYIEDELLQLSALQHLAFCPRQWGLIHLENVWEENRLTMEGRLMHDKPDEPATEVRGDVRIARGLRIRSLRLGLSGRADVVEFHRVPDDEAHREVEKNRAIRLRGVSGFWRPFPVEYKRGKPKPGTCDMVQLCAQALCLEEMLETRVSNGALFYGRTHRRHDVEFDQSLRDETEALSARVHELDREGTTPAPVPGPHCKSCSLSGYCMPKVAGKNKKIERYLASALIDGED